MDYNSLSDDDLLALSNKNYDALSDDGLLFLANTKQPKRDTTKMEDFQIGLHNAAAPVVKWGGMVAGAIPSYLGDTETADKIYKGTDETLKSMEDYWVPKDAEQKTFGGKALSVGTTLPQQLLSFPFSPADTGKTLVDAGEDGSWNGSAQGGAALDTLGNLVGVALPGSLGGGLLKKFGSGAAINALQDTAVKQAISAQATTEKGKKAFEPTVESAALAAMVGGPMGTLSPSKPQISETKPPAPIVDKTDPSIKTNSYVPSSGELTMLKRVYDSSLDKIANIEKAMTDVNDAIAKTPDDVPSHLLDTFKELEDQHRALSNKTKEIENILSDPEQIPDSFYTEMQIHEDSRINNLRAQRKARRGPRSESTEPTEADIANRFGDEEPTKSSSKTTDENGNITVEVGGKDPHTITYTLGEDGRVKRKIVYPDGTVREDFLVETKDGEEMFVTSDEYAQREYYPQTLSKDQLKTWLSHEHPTTESTGISKSSPEAPKMSPVEVAVSRIGEAMSMPKEKLTERLQKARDALDTLPERIERNDSPGSQYSSIKNSLEQEVKAYESLLRGEKPDLGWFEGKQEAPKTEQLSTDPIDPRQPPIEAYTFNETTKEGSYRSAVDGRTRSPAQAYQHHTYNYNKLSRILENVNKQIAAYDSGQTPSGTFDIAKATAMRESLERQIEMHRNALENVLQNSPELRDKLNKPVGEKQPEVPNVPKEKYTSVQEAVEKSGDNMVNAFLDNMNLFSSKQGSNVHFDSKIPVEFQRVMRGMLETLGLGKEKVFILDSVVNKTGRVEHFGNTTVIHLNRAALTARFGNSAFGTLRVASHEMGHFLFNKYLQETITHVDELNRLDEAFKDYISKNKIEPSFSNDTPSLLKTQQWFHEFFAERTARALMYDHVLNKFAPKSKYLAALSKMLTDSYMKLRKSFNLTKQNFVDEIVSDIISGNKESIAATGQTIFEKMQRERNDKAIVGNRDPDAYPFAKATLEDVLEKAQDMGWLIPNKERRSLDKTNFDPQQVPMIGRRALDALGNGAAFVSRKLFGKTGLAQIFKDNPIIQDVYWKIRDAEMNASNISNKLWFGDAVRATWNEAGFFAKMSKIKEKASAYMVVKQSKPEDMAAVHDVLKKGFEEGLEYQQTLDKHGILLTEEQKGIYNSLTNMFNKQYEAMVKAQTDMGKKNILPRRKGWYPSVRKGDYFVDINFQGTSAYRQHFATKAEGEAFLEKLGQGNLKHLSATGVEKIKLEDSNPFLDSIDTFKDFLEKKYPQAGGVLKKDIEGLVQALITKGGKLGKHHVQRSNLEGYKGSEIFADNKERGNSFKEAIQSSVGDYTGTLRKMQINHYVEPLLRNGQESMHPDTYAAVKQMTDSALNKVENKAQGIDDWVRNSVDSMVKKGYDIVGKDFKPGDPVFDKVKNGMLEAFYLTKLMAKPVFAIGQVLSTPVQAIRHMAYDGGFRAYMSFGKGLLSLATNNKDLKDSMFRVSQTTNVFEPQFIEALHLNKNDSSLLEGIKKWVFLNKVNEGADSFSRVLTYASMYEHYKSLGKTPAEAERLAMHGTDATMVQYGSSEQAPVFKHTGIAGEMARPLQTFGQAQLANIIGDIRHFQTMKPSTWAPLLTYGLTATLMGGAISPTFVTEYELIRKWLGMSHPEYALPSILDIVAHDDSIIDRILPDSDAARKAVLYGLPSMTGLDLASSVRANQGFATLLLSVLSAEENWQAMFPLITYAATTASGMGTIASELMGKKHTDGELSKGISAAMPTGPLTYGTKELFGVNETNLFGDNTGMMPLGNTGTAEKPREPIDIVAGVLGTKGTDDKFETQKALHRTEIDKNRQTQIKKLADLAIETGDQKYLEKIVSYGLDEKTLKSMIGSEVWSRLADVETRYLVNSKGKAPANYETARKASLLNKFRSSE